MSHSIWDDLFDEDMLAGINAKLRAAQRVADRQAFGMPRPEGTVEFRKIITEVKAELDGLLTRLDACEPKIKKVKKL